MNLYPRYYYKRIYNIPLPLLQEKGVRCLILDVDNTLTTHDNPVPSAGVKAWLEKVRQSGIQTVILSNNSAGRVASFADILGLPYVSEGKKPLTSGFRRCARRFGVLPEECAVIGDQLFTDIWGGNRFGCLTILVEPIQPEAMWFFRLKRRMERRLLRQIGPPVHGTRGEEK